MIPLQAIPSAAIIFGNESGELPLPTWKISLPMHIVVVSSKVVINRPPSQSRFSARSLTSATVW
jgi:hypothetical protein